MNCTLKKYLYSIFLVLFVAFLPDITNAATLNLSPATGVYSAGSTFTVRVTVDTAGKPINAAEGTVTFNPQELTVISVNKAGSIFNLWVTEPVFSNSAGTVSFSGGLPSGYTGSGGTVFSVTFRTTSASNARVSLTGGSVLANDGMGTNILTRMNGGTYTVQAPSTNPVAEVVEYVAPANTPAAPRVVSDTHGDSSLWYQSNQANLSWQLPAGVTAVRTLLDKSPSSVPTKVYDNPISEISLTDLPQGVSYFHIQFKNADGWGRVTSYRLAVDSDKPSKFDISLDENTDSADPAQVLNLDVEDLTSGVTLYKVKIDNDEVFDYLDEDETKKLKLPNLTPGYHTIIIEAFDKAGNSLISTFSLTIESFAKPVFTEYPSEINEEVIPVIRGLTRPESAVIVTMSRIGSEPSIYNLNADADGVFTLIPSGTLTMGVYEISAVATDKFGAQSEKSEVIKIAVQQPGYVQVGSFLVNILSVIIPLVAMTGLLVLATWFMIVYFRRFRRKVSVESGEVAAIIAKEFKMLNDTIEVEKISMAEARKTKKLTKAEEDAFLNIENVIRSSQKRIEKEVSDVERLVQKKD